MIIPLKNTPFCPISALGSDFTGLLPAAPSFRTRAKGVIKNENILTRGAKHCRKAEPRPFGRKASILEILYVCLRLKSSPALNFNKIERFSKALL
jgi:hypothetical protein